MSQKIRRTILRTGGRVEIYRNSKPIFPRPLESAEDVLPARARQERFAFPYIDGPERDRYSDPIKPSTRDLRKILFGLSGERAQGPWQTDEGRTKGGTGQDAPNVEFQGGSTYDKSIIVAFQLGESAVRPISRHQSANRPFINRAGVRVPLE